MDNTQSIKSFMDDIWASDASCETAIKILGAMGRIMWHSKGDYNDRNPGNKVFFNGNIFDSNGKKLWYGDIDLTKQMDKLKALASALGGKVYCTSEQPYRFGKVTPEMLEKHAAYPDRPQVVVVTGS